MISKISRILVEITIFLMLCGQMLEYDAGFNAPPQTIERGIVTYTTVDSRGKLNIKLAKLWMRRR